MHVLHATLSFEPGGRREAIRTLALRQRGLGVTSSLCCLDRLGCDPALATEVFADHCILGRHGLFDRRAVRQFRAFCRERRIDIVHAHDAASQALAAQARGVRPRFRLLMTFHRSLGFESARWSDRLRNAAATVMCGAVVVGSRERRRHFLSENHVPPRKVVRIPFGIDLARFQRDTAARAEIRRELGVADDTILFGAAGHFGQEKGIDVALSAFRLLQEGLADRRRVRLVILGGGTPQQQSALHALAAGIGPEAVHFAGFRRDVERWFSALDVFVHAARQEAFGLVLAEAMACGLPVVATSVGGIPDIVRHGETGLLAPSDDPPALAAALRQLQSNAEMRDQFGAAARLIAAQDYSSDVYARRYLELYRDLLSDRPPRGVPEAGTDEPSARDGTEFAEQSADHPGFAPERGTLCQSP